MRKSIIVPTHRAKKNYHGYSHSVGPFDIKEGQRVRIVENEDGKESIMLPSLISHALCPFPRFTNVSDFFTPLSNH